MLNMVSVTKDPGVEPPQPIDIVPDQGAHYRGASGYAHGGDLLSIFDEKRRNVGEKAVPAHTANKIRVPFYETCEICLDNLDERNSGSSYTQMSAFFNKISPKSLSPVNGVWLSNLSTISPPFAANLSLFPAPGLNSTETLNNLPPSEKDIQRFSGQPQLGLDVLQIVTVGRFKDVDAAVGYLLQSRE